MTLFLASCALICGGLLMFTVVFWLHFERDVDPKNEWTGGVGKLGLVVAGLGLLMLAPGLLSVLL